MPMNSLPLEMYTSMYRCDMWCLCFRTASSRCSRDSNRTRASPFRRPTLDRTSAMPPGTMFKPRKKRSMSLSVACQGRPRARTTVSSSITSVRRLYQESILFTIMLDNCIEKKLMYMYVCMYVCICICMYVCICICMYMKDVYMYTVYMYMKSLFSSHMMN